MVTAMQSSGSLSTSSSLSIATGTEPLNWSGRKANGRPKSAAYFYSTLVTPLFRRHAESGNWWPNYDLGLDVSSKVFTDVMLSVT
jgi:hypothetical protein